MVSTARASTPAAPAGRGGRGEARREGTFEDRSWSPAATDVLQAWGSRSIYARPVATAEEVLNTDLGLGWLPVAIARLGDMDVHGWWRSHGMDSIGEYVLSDLFPRTWSVAGAEISLLSAAKRHHDALPERANVLQLFGEPFPAFRQAVAWLAELKTGGDTSSIDALRKWDRATATELLRQLLGEPPSGERIAGTQRLGQLSREALTDHHAMMVAGRALASAYVDQTDGLHIPYFDLA